MPTVISHIYNEEFMLPYWVKHHRRLFNHGIIIDYHSTDSSMDIVRELAPDWTIVKTRNEFFVEPAIGEEVEFYEKQISGWKMALNVTEFLLLDDLAGYCKTLEIADRAGIRTNGVIMVDPVEKRGQCSAQPLLLQKTFGYFEKDVLIRPSVAGRPVRSRSRLLHRSDCGHYFVGRHNNGVTDQIDPYFYLCWFGWSPFNDQVKNRKLSIQTKVSDEQRQKESWARLYVIDEARLEEMYMEEASRSYNLLNFPTYQAAYDSVKRLELGDVSL